MKQFSQNDEDVHILQALSSVQHGKLLDVGAYTGKDLSNSLALINSGWDAILLEPSPRPFAACMELHRANPRVKCVNAALSVAEAPGLTQFQFTDDAVSTDHPGFHQLWGKVVPYSPAYINTLSVDKLLSWAGADFSPDFITVDTEGSTLELTFALLAREQITRNLKCICVEHVELGQNRRAEFDAVICPLGFRVVYESGENLVYAKA